MVQASQHTHNRNDAQGIHKSWSSVILLKQHLSIFVMQNCIGLYALPKFIASTQASIVHKHWEMVGGINTPSAGAALCCLRCTSIKTTAMTSAFPMSTLQRTLSQNMTRSKTSCVVSNLGSTQVVVDDEENMIMCEACIDSANKLDQPVDNTLVFVPMIGQILEIGSKCYITCTSCGRITSTTGYGISICTECAQLEIMQTCTKLCVLCQTPHSAQKPRSLSPLHVVMRFEGAPCQMVFVCAHCWPTIIAYNNKRMQDYKRLQNQDRSYNNPKNPNNLIELDNLKAWTKSHKIQKELIKARKVCAKRKWTSK